jgi:hypothetical protein
MAETKPTTTETKPAPAEELPAEREKREKAEREKAHAERLTAPMEPPTPTQAEADAINEGTYQAPIVPGATAKREREREAKPAGESAGYKTR